MDEKPDKRIYRTSKDVVTALEEGKYLESDLGIMWMHNNNEYLVHYVYMVKDEDALIIVLEFPYYVVIKKLNNIECLLVDLFHFNKGNTFHEIYLN